MKKETKKQIIVFFILFIFLFSSISYAIIYVFPVTNTVHWHAKLNIYIEGELLTIPANVGLTGAEVHPAVIHTHDIDNILHKEGPADLTLGNFFEVWEQTFTSTCILEFCDNSTHQLRMTVNGIDNMEYGDYVFQDQDVIEIDYSKI